MGADQPPSQDILRGTLDLLILKALSWGPLHGYAVARWIEGATADALAVGEGSLYPALHRLEKRGWLRADWRTTESGRDAKFYTLTAAGRKRLAAERSEWDRFSRAIALVLHTAR